MRAGDTIVAVATAAGPAAIGIVRVSGPEAIPRAAAIIRGREPLAAFSSHRARKVRVVDPETGTVLDQALCTVMRAPASYTGEDVVEISCHGSPPQLVAMTRRIIAAGARLAEPGEFTRRAFLNGRIDLAQAEAIALLIGARTERAATLAARALSGGFGSRLHRLREAMLDLVARLEVTLDFPEDEAGVDLEKAAALVTGWQEQVNGWLASAEHGRVVHEGLTVAIVGAQNAGKSSLFNALVGRDRAIVSPRPGTTRDVVEATVGIQGVPVRLLDTAGIGEAGDDVEAEGIRRSREMMAASDLLVVVLDGTRPVPTLILEETAGRPRVLVRSKSDLLSAPSGRDVERELAVSAMTGKGLDELMEALARDIDRRAGRSGEEDGVVASLRQSEALRGLKAALGAAGEALRTHPLEIALVELREAMGHVGTLTGVEIGEEVLDRIFSTFCIGK
jgi:tRNA modification GTPase